MRLDRLGSPLAVLFIGLGLLAIGIGWNGAAGIADVRAQFPYLISGGLLGVGLIGVGAALLVVDNARTDRMHLEAKLDQIAELLARRESVPGAAVTAPRDLTGLVVAGSASYHAGTCRLVEGRDEVHYLTPAEADARGLAPCRICKPAPVGAASGQPAVASATGAGAGAAAP